MSAPPIPSSPVKSVGITPPDSSLWTRLTTFASENKAIVYTIGAVVVVAGAGGIYYISQQSRESGKAGKAKKDRRKDIKDKASSKEKKVADGENSNWALFMLKEFFFPSYRIQHLRRFMTYCGALNMLIIYIYMFQKTNLNPQNRRKLIPR